MSITDTLIADVITACCVTSPKQHLRPHYRETPFVITSIVVEPHFIQVVLMSEGIS